MKANGEVMRQGAAPTATDRPNPQGGFDAQRYNSQNKRFSKMRLKAEKVIYINNLAEMASLSQVIP